MGFGDGVGGPELAAAIVTFAFLFLSLMVWRKNVSQRLRLPPGPTGWPGVGNLLSLGHLPHRSLYKLSRKYGPIMFMRLGSVPTLVVSSPQIAKEVLQKHDLIMASRPTTILSLLLFKQQDIAWATYGHHWRNARKICIQEMLSPARINQFQDTRQEEVLATVHSMLEKSQQGQTVSVNETLSMMTINIITQIMLSKRYYGRKEDSNVATETEFHKTVQEIFDVIGAFNIADYIPILRRFDPQGLEKRARNVQQRLDKFLEHVIKEHAEKPSNDFLGRLLQVSKNDNGDQFEESQTLSTDTIKLLVSDMLLAGSDTSTTTMEWALAECLRNPLVMGRVQEELDSVVGPNRLVKEDDIPKLKYLQAVVKETLRLHPAGPLALPHESTEKCEVAGYDIPARIRVLINIWAIQRDPAIWEKPDEFDPNRFLNSDVDVKGQDFQLVPFGSGRRICVGLNLAMVMIQYQLAQFLHTMTWTLSGDEKPEDMNMSESFGLVCRKADQLQVVTKQRLSTHVIYPEYTT